VAELHARQGLDLDVADGSALVLGEPADLRLRELDVLDRLLRHLADDRFHIGWTQFFWNPLVELLRVLAHRRIAALPHVGEDRLHGLTHFPVELIGERLRDAAFEVGWHDPMLS
jgi:hypothetical protein